MTAKKGALLDKAFAALLSDDDAQALEALALIHEKGDAGSILPLLHALAHTDDLARQRRMEGLLFEVKVKDAAAELAKALDMPELLDVRKTAIAAFWNADLDAGPYVERLAQIAVEGDAGETFEVLTVIENQELLPEKAARLALARLKKAVGKEKDPYKQALLEDLKRHLADRLGVE
ncbi:MAG: hypothetical protein KBH07_00845 [Flavobacteriales bacterium]|nr:hypothetical protein [Flavobacteriales bacterium]MBP9079324.1 hypothetical protein [Flavobacteriales bacterium]